MLQTSIIWCKLIQYFFHEKYCSNEKSKKTYPLKRNHEPLLSHEADFHFGLGDSGNLSTCAHNCFSIQISTICMYVWLHTLKTQSNSDSLDFQFLTKNDFSFKAQEKLFSKDFPRKYSYLDKKNQLKAVTPGLSIMYKWYIISLIVTLTWIRILITAFRRYGIVKIEPNLQILYIGYVSLLYICTLRYAIRIAKFAMM